MIHFLTYLHRYPRVNPWCSVFDHIDATEVDVIIGAMEVIEGFADETLEKHNLVLAYDRFPLTTKEISLETYKKLPHVSADFGKQDNFS